MDTPIWVIEGETQSMAVAVELAMAGALQVQLAVQERPPKSDKIR